MRRRADPTRPAPRATAFAATASPVRRTLPFFLLSMLALAWAAAPAFAEGAYSYLRTVDGYGELRSTTDGETLELRENHPILAGDWMGVDGSSRVEAVLADGTIARFGGGSEIGFETLAWTSDSSDTVTRLRLDRGAVQLVVSDLVGEAASLELEAGNATLYLRPPGRYMVRLLAPDVTEVVVREGFAEANTDHGSIVVRDGEAARIEGSEWPSVELVDAGGFDRLELWGEELEAEARLAESSEVEPELRYRAARMDRYGSWVDAGGRRGWRPHVTSDWRPYHDGSWVYTPSGLTWVSAEPWGWVPYHYGTWDLVPGIGWTWFAGARYAPAWVYWYWGPTHVAWVPSGYYTAYYAPHHRRYSYGPRFGIYGWAGGSWGFFAEWTFCPTRYFGRWRYRNHYRVGRQAAHHSSFRNVPRGVIASDTRSLTRDVWRDSARAAGRLEAHARATRTELRDVSEFVARRRDVSAEVARLTRPEEVKAQVRATAARARSVAAEPEAMGRPLRESDLRSRTAATRSGSTVIERRTELAPERGRIAEPRSRVDRPETGDRRGTVAERPGAVDRTITGRATLDLRRYGRPSTAAPADRTRVTSRFEPRAVEPSPSTSRSTGRSYEPADRYGDRYSRRGRSEVSRSREEAPVVSSRSPSIGRRVIDQVRKALPARPPSRASAPSRSRTGSPSSSTPRASSPSPRRSTNATSSPPRPSSRASSPPSRSSSRASSPPRRSSSPPPRATSSSSSRRGGAISGGGSSRSRSSSTKARSRGRKPPAGR